MELLLHLLDPCSCLLLLLLAMLHVAAAGNEEREKGRGAGAKGTEYHPVQFTMHEIIHILFSPFYYLSLLSLTAIGTLQPAQHRREHQRTLQTGKPKNHDVIVCAEIEARAL